MAIRARRRPVATRTTATTASGQPAHAQSVRIVPSAPPSVTFPGAHFNSYESGAPPSYEAAIAYPAASS